MKNYEAFFYCEYELCEMYLLIKEADELIFIFLKQLTNKYAIFAETKLKV